MDPSVLIVLDRITAWRETQITPNGKSKYRWTGWHLVTVRYYFKVHSNSYEYRKLPLLKLFKGAFLIYTSPESSPVRVKTARFFTHWLKQFFVVPRLKKSLQIENRLNKCQLVEVFLSFLLRLLYEKPDSAFNRIGDLEKELRFLHTVVGDTSFMQCGEQEEFEKLLSEFEAVANEAGRFVHFLLFSPRRAFNKSNKRLDFILNKIDHLKGNIMKFLNLLPFIMTCIPPKTSVVDALPIVDSLIHDLEDLMNREDNRIAEAEGQIRALHRGLISLQSSIKDFGPPQPSQIGELKEPLMQMGDLAREAEYLIVSCFNGEAPCWYLISRLTRVNHCIGLIGAKIQGIMEEHKAGGLLDPKYFSLKLSLSVEKNIEADNHTVVFDDNERYILDQLVGQGAGRQVISIFGMPGLGKTFFAKRMYNHRLVIETFDRRSWCVISQTYNRRRVLTDILNDLTSDFRADEEERLVEHIHKQLKGRRYLIVMDDIWDSNVWDDLQRCFPDDGNGSRILLTTRIKDVAPPYSLLYTLPLLTDDQCWELLEKKVFRNERCPLELQGIGWQIAANCCGLPLTVVVTAGILLALDKKERAWAEVSKNLALLIGGDNSVMQILELSYIYLPDYLKPCFLYFGLFEEDIDIPVGELSTLWIGEGFIAKEDGKRKENVAEGYLMELIDKSLVVIGRRRSDGRVKTCFIHDLLRDLCLKLSVEENFIQFVETDDPIYKKGQRIVVHKFDNGFLSWSCPHVRSLHSNEHSKPYVRDMRLLRVLHLNCCYAKPPVGIEYLVNLRYLVIGDLPASIGSLVNLEYLQIENRYVFGQIYLSQPILRMGKLRYLVVRPKGAYYCRDCNSSQTNNLECLSGIYITDDRDVEMLKSSPHLRKLKCYLEFNESGYSLDLCFLTQLESLSIECITLRFSKWGNLEFSFPTNLKKLTLSLCDFAWEEMSIIGRLDNLEVLKLFCSPFFSNKKGIWKTTEGEFQKLKFLKLVAVDDLIQWNVASSQHFPNLQRLILIDCRHLQEIPLEIGEITTLEMLEIRGKSLESLVDSVKNINEQQKKMGNEDLSVITTDCPVIQPDWMEEILVIL